MGSRRDQIRMTDEELGSFLTEQRIVQVATVGPKGRPHVVPLWYVVHGQELGGWTYAASQKAQNLERDPRATLSVDDGVRYHELRGVMMECDVTIDRDPDRVAEWGLELFARYQPGADVGEMVVKQASKRVGLRFTPTRTVTWDHRKLEGGY